MLSAYEFLLDHHLSWYLNNNRADHVGRTIFEIAGDQLRLTFDERRRILLAHIRGVDIRVEPGERSLPISGDVLLNALRGFVFDQLQQKKLFF